MTRYPARAALDPHELAGGRRMVRGPGINRIGLLVALAAVSVAGSLAAVRTVASGEHPWPPEPDAAAGTGAEGAGEVRSATGAASQPEGARRNDGRDGSRERRLQAEVVGSDAVDERGHLDRLRDLAGRDPERALGLADEGEIRFAGGELEEERQATAINVLVRLGRMGEARARTRAFIRRYPTGRFTRQVRGLTGVHPRPAGPDRVLEW